MKVSRILATLSLIAASTFPLGAKPNVVVFLVDDLGYMDIGANNPDCFYETPNIDKLANSGMLLSLIHI